jgi:tripartite-type tricarboxylate transporter receptor subunit TctC
MASHGTGFIGSVVTALLAGSMIWSATTPARSADFYAGKTLTVIVGTDEAGGFSIYSRLIASYLGRYIPGAPNVIVQNMPGAGGSTAAAYLYHQAPRDGTTIANLTPDSIMDRLFGRKSEIDPTQFEYLAGAERSTRLCATSALSHVKTLEQALKDKVIIGATQVGSPTSDYANLIKRTTAAKFEIVNGYAGTGALYLAMERGEIDGMCGFDWSALKAQKPELLRDKKINLLVQVNVKSDPELDALGVPQPWKFIPDSLDHQAVELMIDFQQAFGKAYVAPPQVPGDRLKLLRDAFEGVLGDKQFLAEAEKIRIEITPVSGADVAATVRNLYAAPTPVVERLRAITVDAKAQ